MPSLSSLRSDSEDNKSIERFSISSEGISISMRDIIFIVIALVVLGYLYYKCKSGSSD